MLHFETRTDTWYLDGHAVDPYEDFAAIKRANHTHAERQGPPNRKVGTRLDGRGVDGVPLSYGRLREAVDDMTGRTRSN